MPIILCTQFTITSVSLPVYRSIKAFTFQCVIHKVIAALQQNNINVGFGSRTIVYSYILGIISIQTDFSDNVLNFIACQIDSCLTFRICRCGLFSYLNRSTLYSYTVYISNCNIKRHGYGCGSAKIIQTEIINGHIISCGILTLIANLNSGVILIYIEQYLIKISILYRCLIFASINPNTSRICRLILLLKILTNGCQLI